jgi:hypothetical protein
VRGLPARELLEQSALALEHLAAEGLRALQQPADPSIATADAHCCRLLVVPGADDINVGDRWKRRAWPVTAASADRGTALPEARPQ